MSDDGILIGGREKRPIVLEDWGQHWVERFEQERERIVRALGDVARRTEHIGSTSVPGLAAKPIIDIQLSMADVEDEASYVPAMEAAGYVLRVREPGHRMFRTSHMGVQIHVCATGSEWERRHLLFRDWLRRSSEDRARYEAAKRELAQREWDDVNDYADAKSAMINEIIVRAESWAAATGGLCRGSFFVTDFSWTGTTPARTKVVERHCRQGGTLTAPGAQLDAARHNRHEGYSVSHHEFNRALGSPAPDRGMRAARPSSTR